MLNNEFRLVGIAISDYIKPTVLCNLKATLTIEVEKRRGNTMKCCLSIPTKNSTIDVEKSVKGKMVVVFGYIDGHENSFSLYVQDIAVVGNYDERKEN